MADTTSIRRLASFVPAPFFGGQGAVSSPTNRPPIISGDLWSGNLNHADAEIFQTASIFGSIFGDGDEDEAPRDGDGASRAQEAAAPSVTTILLMGTVIIGIVIAFKVLK